MVLGTSQSVAASPPDHIKSEMFLCPSVSPNNPNGMWVIGGSGVYYVNFPGIASPNWIGTMEGMMMTPPVMGGNLNPFKAVEENPADVEGKAQVKAGKGLYNKLDGVPDGTIVMVLPEDGTGYLFDTFDLTVMPGLYKLYPQTNGPSEYSGPPYPMDMPGMPIPVMGELYANVPLKSAAFW